MAGQCLANRNLHVTVVMLERRGSIELCLRLVHCFDTNYNKKEIHSQPLEMINSNKMEYHKRLLLTLWIQTS